MSLLILSDAAMFPFTNGQAGASPEIVASAVLAKARHEKSTAVLLSDLVSIDPLELAFQLVRQNEQGALRGVIIGPVSDLADVRRLCLPPVYEPSKEASVPRVFTVDMPGREVVSGGVRLSCSPMELRLLIFFLRYPGIVFSRTELLRRISARWASVKPRMIDVLIQRLRGRIEANPATPSHLWTVAGVGYVFRHTSDVFLDNLTGRQFLSWPHANSTNRNNSFMSQ
jgi:DNA-binding winged helix-turn-helix (wHTH) protein